jgi:cyanophycin synthetase
MEGMRVRGTGLDPSLRPGWYSDVWRQAADVLGAEFVTLPGGFCEVRHGERVTRMLQQLVMLDDPVTLRLAGHKPLVHRLLAGKGLPVPPHRGFNIRALEPALAFLRDQSGACVVKPARQTGAGRGVTTGIRGPRALAVAAARAAAFDPELLIESQVLGDSYRLLYLDGRLLDAVRRRLPRVVGDGRSTVAALIAAENRRRARQSGATVLVRIPMDQDCRATLREAGLSLRSVPARGAEVTVKGVANYGGEADTETVRGEIGTGLLEQAARAAAALGVRLAGVDVITRDPAKSLDECGGVVNEVNTTPGLHFHYQVHNQAAMVPVAVPILRVLLGLGPGQEATGDRADA